MGSVAHRRNEEAEVGRQWRDGWRDHYDEATGYHYYEDAGYHNDHDAAQQRWRLVLIASFKEI